MAARMESCSAADGTVRGLSVARSSGPMTSSRKFRQETQSQSRLQASRCERREAKPPNQNSLSRNGCETQDFRRCAKKDAGSAGARVLYVTAVSVHSLTATASSSATSARVARDAVMVGPTHHHEFQNEFDESCHRCRCTERCTWCEMPDHRYEIYYTRSVCSGAAREAHSRSSHSVFFAPKATLKTTRTYAFSVAR